MLDTVFSGLLADVSDAAAVNSGDSSVAVVAWLAMGIAGLAGIAITAAVATRNAARSR